MVVRQAMALMVLAAIVAGCGGVAQLPDIGRRWPSPTLPPPEKSLIPTVHVATATGWPADAKPAAAAGLAVARFADGLQHPRWLYVLPNGDVLVAETNAPPKPEDGKGITRLDHEDADEEGGRRRRRARTASRCCATRTATASPRRARCSCENLTFAVRDGARRQRSLRRGDRRAAAFPVPAGRDRDHRAAGRRSSICPAGRSTITGRRTSSPAADGSKLYVTVGSNSNVAENGIDKEDRARRDLGGRSRRPARTACSPRACAIRTAWRGSRQTGALWTAVNERDELGSDLVPDYMTSVKDGGFYGWPYSYYGQHVDARVEPPRPDLVAKAIVPDYALGPHTASLGLASSRGTTLARRLSERHVRRAARLLEPQAAQRL